MPNIKPISDLRNYTAVINEVAYGNRVYLTRNGHGQCAIIDMKELDELDKKIKEKEEIIEDKQDQIKYLRTLIDDYKEQVRNNTDSLELQLKKISKTYESLIAQKDMIIEKQDKLIEDLSSSSKQAAKASQDTITSLELQIGNYREMIKKME